MRQQLLIILVLFGLLISGCKKVRLDALAFPSERLEQYEFESYLDPEIPLPSDYSLNPLEQYLIPLQSIDKITGNVYTIYGLYIGDTANISSDTVIFYCHGQAKHMDNYWTRAALLANVGGSYNYGVFMIDYRGYGMSEGSSTEQGLSEDAHAGIDWLISKGVSSDKMIYYGYSLGAIPLIERAANRSDINPAKIIVEAPLASVEYLTQNSTVLGVQSEFVSDLKFENAEMIKHVTAPFLWIHGVEDDYVSIDNGEVIYNNYQGVYKEAIRVENSNHANIPPTISYQNYLKVLLEFIRK